MENVDISWTFQYNLNTINKNDYEGLFIIGIESLEKAKNADDLISIYSILTPYGEIWKFQIDELYIGNYVYEINDEELKIDSDIEGFEIPKKLFDILNQIYFGKYFTKKICESEIVTESLMVIFCHSDKFNEIDIEKFPEINLYKYKIGFNFSFSGKELFFQKDKKYFFRMIIETKSTVKDYKIGRIFLKKYQVIFNSDAKSMIFYINNNKKNIYGNYKKKNVFFSVISYVLIGIFFLTIGIIFGRKYCFIDKKRLANELEDNNYVYKSKKDDIKKEGKLIEMS